MAIWRKAVSLVVLSFVVSPTVASVSGFKPRFKRSYIRVWRFRWGRQRLGRCTVDRCVYIYCERGEILIHAESASEHRPRRSGVEVAYSSFWRATASSVHTCLNGGPQTTAWIAPRFGRSVTLGGICAGSGGHLNPSKFSRPTNDDRVRLPRVNFAKLQTTPPPLQMDTGALQQNSAPLPRLSARGTVAKKRTRASTRLMLRLRNLGYLSVPCLPTHPRDQDDARLNRVWRRVREK